MIVPVDVRISYPLARGRPEGRYELLRKIADGGMARVYAARVFGAAGFERLVAVKLMLPSFGAQPEMRQMFLDEARVSANIRSPHVVSTLDLGLAEDGSPYLVMDLVIGSTLGALCRGFARRAGAIPISLARSGAATSRSRQIRDKPKIDVWTRFCGVRPEVTSTGA